MFDWLKKTLPVSKSAGRTSDTQMPSDGSLVKFPPSNEYAAHRKRGNEFLAQGRLEEAAECYRQAIAVDPGYAEGLLNLGFVSGELGLYEDAENSLKQAVQIDPALADAYYLLGSIAQMRGNPADAIERFEKALELKPEFEVVYSDLYKVLLQNGRTESAEKVIQRGLSVFPQSVQFHCYLGNLYVKERKLEQAIACYRKALLIQPDYAEVQILLGNALKALAELTKLSLQRSPEVIDHGQLHSGVPKTGRRLHIGGEYKCEGWEILNANPAPYVDHVCNANDLSQFENDTFEQLYASHIVEHLDYMGELHRTLVEWNRVLVPGGTVFISVPDIDTLSNLLLQKDELDIVERFFAMRMMFGGHVNKYDYHVVGLNQDFLESFLYSSGYVNIRRVQNFGLFPDTSSKVFKGVPISLNMIAEKPRT